MISETISRFYTLEEYDVLHQNAIPYHIAFIPDGNRRWAKKQCESVIAGHQSGANVLMNIIKAAKELGIKVLTFYSFSTENWDRSKDEIASFMWLLQTFLHDECENMKENDVRLNAIGDLTKLPREVVDELENAREATKRCSGIDVVLALNYGARDEMRRAICKIVDDCSTQKLQKEQITESLISKYLDTAPWGDPELIIRTSGELRLSNYLLWQSSYSEFYSTPVLWPEFSAHELLKAILDFQKRKRRMGGH